EVLTSFTDFRMHLPFQSESSITSSRRWVPSRGPLKELRDEETRDFPKNCVFKGNGQRKFSLYQQTVVREVTSTITYYYDKEIVNFYLEKENAIQLSTLIIHEWLW